MIRFARIAPIGAMLVVAFVFVMMLIGPGGAQEPSPGPAPTETREAIFAGGCFWCMEPPYDKLDGVIATTSGYTGGRIDNPTYKQVSAGGTGHYEAVRVTYDPAKVDYATLLEVYWRNIDPFDAHGQFCDKGESYRAAIFVASDEERVAAEASKSWARERLASDEPIVTEIQPVSAFYEAEDYHQDYYIKNPVRYRFYRTACGRDARLRKVWGESS